MRAFFGHFRFVTVVSFSVVAGKVAFCRVNGDINVTTSGYFVVHYCTLFWSWHMVIVGLLSMYLSGGVGGAIDTSVFKVQISAQKVDVRVCVLATLRCFTCRTALLSIVQL